MQRVLLIDDEPGIRNLVKLALTRAGYDVEAAADGREGLRKFDAGRFDIVITDIRMPELSGNEVLHHVKQSPGRDVPVLGISGTPWELENKGFQATLSKPFRIQTLVQAVTASAGARSPKT